MSESASAERRRITGRAAIVAAGTLLSRVLGLGRELTIAALFGRAATDAFFVAFTIPNVLRQLVAEGAVQNAMLPVLAETRQKHGDARAREAFAALRGLSLTVLVALTALGVALAPWIVEAFAGGYRQTPGQFARTVTLTRWLFPYIFFMGSAALGVAALNTHRKFVVTSFAPALLNVAMIGCALALTPTLAARGIEPVMALVVGALLGGLLQVLAQWPALRSIGYLGLPRLSFRDPAVREVLRRMAPVLFGIGVYQIDVMVARRLLSELPLGSQTYFTFAMRLCDLPQGVFVMALQAATLPSLADLAARGDRLELARTTAYGLRLSLFAAVPASVFFLVAAEPVVVAVLQRGAFDGTAATETARALVAQGVGIAFVAGVRQLVGTFFALGDTRTPVIVASLDFVVFVALALALRGPFGHVGVGLAVSGAGLAQLCLLWLGLRRHLPDLGLRDVLPSLARIGLGAALAALAAWAVGQGTAGWLDGGPLLRLLPAPLAAVAFGAVYLLTGLLTRSPELEDLGAPVLRRLRRR